MAMINEYVAATAAQALGQWFDREVAKGSDPRSVAFAMVGVGADLFVQATPDLEEISAFAHHLHNLAEKVGSGAPLLPFGHA